VWRLGMLSLHCSPLRSTKVVVHVRSTPNQRRRFGGHEGGAGTGAAGSVQAGDLSTSKILSFVVCLLSIARLTTPTSPSWPRTRRPDFRNGGPTPGPCEMSTGWVQTASRGPRSANRCVGRGRPSESRMFSMWLFWTVFICGSRKIRCLTWSRIIIATCLKASSSRSGAVLKRFTLAPSL
jgi:hypothetical protein